MKVKILFQAFWMLIVSCVAIAQTESFDFSCDCPHTVSSYNNNVSLNHVTFHGNQFDELIPIEEDGFGLYPEIQFFSNSTYYPVAYVSGSRAILSAAFTSSCNHPLWIRGTFDNGVDKFCFAPIYISPIGYGDYYYPITASDKSFGDAFGNDHVDAFPEFEIYWEVSPDGKDYAHVGTSVNPLYVTYHSPLPGTVIHHSTIANSCTSAEGTTDPQEIVDAIYELFESKCLTTVSDKGYFDNSCLQYWGDSYLSLACSSSSDLYLAENGRSENFAELFKEMIDVQGIFHSKIKEISYENEDEEALFEDLEEDLSTVFTKPVTKTTMNIVTDAPGIITVDPTLLVPALNYAFYIAYDTDYRAAPLDPLLDGLESTTMMYIKRFPLASDNTFFLTDSDSDNSISSKPNNVSLVKLADENGLGAQGNANPPSRFSKLFLVDYFGTTYDPSYGVTSSSSVTEWEPKVIDGYGIRISDVILRTNDLAPPSTTNKQLDYIHQKEKSGVQQTTVSP